MSLGSVYRRLKGALNHGTSYLIDRVDDQQRVLEGQPPNLWRRIFRSTLSNVTGACWWIQHSPRVDAWQWESEQGSVIYAGSDHHMPQFQTVLRPQESSAQTERVPTWSLAAKNEEWAKTTDLVVTEFNRSQPWDSDGAFSFTVAPWVRTVLDITLPSDDLMRNMRKSMRKRLRKVQKNGFECRYSQDLEDFDLFYHTMLVPFVESRFEEQAITASYDNLIEEFRQGGLILVERDGLPVGGVMCLRTGSTFYSTWGGVLNGDYSLMEAGVQMARVWFGINLAQEMGCRYYDFGRVFASMTDGLMRFKLGWGVQLCTDFRLHETWTFLSRDLSAELRHYLNEQQFLSSDADDHYIVFLQDPKETPNENSIQERMETAQRYGLAGILIVEPGTRKTVPIPNS